MINSAYRFFHEFSKIGNSYAWSRRVIGFLESISSMGRAYIEHSSDVLYSAAQTSISYINKRIRRVRSLSIADQEIQKMWKNQIKAVIEHRGESSTNPSRPREGDLACYVTPEYIRSFSILDHCSEKSNPLTLRAQYRARKGKRDSMQDGYLLSLIKGGLLAGVFDGHGKEGRKVANYAANHFTQYFLEALNKYSIRESFQKVIDRIHEEIIQQDLLKESGSTAVVSFIDVDKHLVYTATLGDSEACVYREIGKEWVAIPLSCVRTWNSRKDAERAGFPLASQGEKKRRYPSPTEGVNVSRSLADTQYSPVTQKTKITVSPLFQGQDRYILLSSDGLKDVLPEKRIIKQLKKQKNEIADHLADYAIYKGSKDNVTVLAIEILQ